MLNRAAMTLPPYNPPKLSPFPPYISPYIIIKKIIIITIIITLIIIRRAREKKRKGGKRDKREGKIILL